MLGEGHFSACGEDADGFPAAAQVGGTGAGSENDGVAGAVVREGVDAADSRAVAQPAGGDHCDKEQERQDEDQWNADDEADDDRRHAAPEGLLPEVVDGRDVGVVHVGYPLLTG